MNFAKKLFFMAVVIPFFFGATSAVAIDLGGDYARQAAKKAGYSENTTETTFAQTLGTVVKAALSFVGVIFLSLMVYAGFLWLNSRGDETQIDKAKEIIKAAIIGLIITVGAYSITAFVVPRVLERTTGPGGGAPTEGAGKACDTLPDPSVRGRCDWIDKDDETHADVGVTCGQCSEKCVAPIDGSECRFRPPEE